MGQIKRGKCGRSGNLHLPMAVLQVFIGQAGSLRPEDDCNLVAGGQRLQLGCHLPGPQRPFEPSRRSGAGGHTQVKGLQGRVQPMGPHGRFQQVVGAAGPLPRLLGQIGLTIHQDESFQAHVLHHTSRRTQVPRGTGLHQNDGNAAEIEHEWLADNSHGKCPTG